MEGNVNTDPFDASAIPPGIVLALPAQPEIDVPGGPDQGRGVEPNQPIARASSEPETTVVNNGFNPQQGVATEDLVTKPGEA